MLVFIYIYTHFPKSMHNLFSFLTALLRYNTRTVQFAHLKFMIPWFLVIYTVVQPSAHSHKWYFIHVVGAYVKFVAFLFVSTSTTFPFSSHPSFLPYCNSSVSSIHFILCSCRDTCLSFIVFSGCLKVHSVNVLYHDQPLAEALQFVTNYFSIVNAAVINTFIMYINSFFPVG